MIQKYMYLTTFNGCNTFNLNTFISRQHIKQEVSISSAY